MSNSKFLKRSASNIKRISIKENELHHLLFWAHVGLGSSYGGSFSKTMPKLIVKYMDKLKLKPYNFCCFKNPIEKKFLSNDVLEEYNKRNTKESECSS